MGSGDRFEGRAAAPRRDGFVLLDKPAGLSSNHALQRAKRILGASRAGHTGSLDPLATGLLPISLGRATRLSRFLLDARKRYSVTARLGEKRSTGDAEGEVVATGPTEGFDDERIEASLAAFRGPIDQVPPMYSALKQNGQRLYRLARAGQEVERAARPVTIHALVLAHRDGPDLELTVECSKGTYVRTLVEDVAAHLGTCAYVTSLRRTAVGPFVDLPLWTLEGLEELKASGGLDEAVLAPDAALEDLPDVAVSAPAAESMLQGRKLAWSGPSGYVRVYAPWGFVGIAERSEEGLLSPRRMFPRES
jgi:tRNA pseudouridine55 synthase